MLAAGLSGFAPSQAYASTTSLVGGGAWSGVASLPTYPCPLSCSITFSGYFAGSITALDSTNQPTFTGTWTALTSTLQADLQAGPLTYNESCGSVPFAPPLTGTASGPFTVSGGVLTQGGSVVGVAQLTGTFSLSRVAGFVINVTLSGVQLRDGSGTVLASAQSAGTGVGLMVGPVEQPSDLPLPPNCAHEVPVSVALAGTYAQPT
jgi:hypothetical protein